jgi:predicted nucleic acid-binding protein
MPYRPDELMVGLAIVDGLGWLKPLFGRVWMPPQVRDKVPAGPVQRGRPAIEAALTAGVLTVWAGGVPALDLPDLDEGEAACIRIALAQPGAALLLMDERAGRAVAAERGLAVAGTAATVSAHRRRLRRGPAAG